MSLSLRGDPFSMRYWNTFDRPTRLFDQHFANPLTEEDFLLPLTAIRPQLSQFLSSSPSRRLYARQPSGISELKQEKDKFQIMLDVQQFKAEELNVKIVDNSIVVEGNHEERADEHGFISRHFVRRYVLPEEVKAESVVCNISSDGVLQISAPRLVEKLAANERAVPINQTGQPAAVLTNPTATQPEQLASGTPASDV